MRRLLLLLVALALVGCAGRISTPSDPAEPLPTLPPTTPIPANALIVFVKEGGLAFSSITLTVNQDGTADLEGSQIAAPVDWAVPADKFQALQKLLNNPAFSFLAYDPDTTLSCADCYVMTVNALTPQGVKSLHYDQADLTMVKDVSPLYDQLVTVMKAIEDSAPTAAATVPPLEPQSTDTFLPHPEAEALPGDVLLVYNRAGGIAYNDITLVVHIRGATELTLNATPQPTQRTISASDFAAIQTILNNPAFAKLPNDQIVPCNDCYIYTITARTPSGILTVKSNDADLSKGQLGLFQDLIGRLQPYALSQ